jgi:hypothetical protein
MIEHINKLFMAVIVLSLLTYFERPDYNLPLFAFILLLWDNAYVKQKQRLWYLMAVSLVVDLIWIIYWASVWGSFNNKEAGLTGFTIFVSVVEFIIKIIIVVLTFLKIDDCKRCVTEIGANVKSIWKGPQQEAGYGYE